jgi:2'-5' RNA ligase
VRLFFALWPPRAAAQALFDWAAPMEGRRMAVENIHLTLAFLGEAEPGRAHEAARRVQGRRLALPIDEARYWKHNRIVWVGPAALPPPLSSLVGRLHGALKEDGFVLEERPFAAHVTLLRKASPPTSLPPLPAVEWPVSEFLLVRSRTSPKGAAYEPVERFALV